MSADYLAGDKKYQKSARLVMPLLVRQATQANKATIFYSDLANEVGMPNERNLNHVLGYIGDALESLSKDWKEPIPPIQCLVINKRDQLPGEGIGWFNINKEDFRKLPRKEQRRLVDIESEKILMYRRWLDVLKALGLRPSVANYSLALSAAKASKATEETRMASFGGGGESPEHKRLKEFIALHPESVGLTSKSFPGSMEESLQSGDTLDVCFQSGQDAVAIEVKSVLSSVSDIVRGMFQCVKYRAVLEAQQSANGLPQSARAILVLESSLPAQLIALKNILGIEVIDQVKPQ